ncbi:MAG: HAD family phosphatase [Methylococcales bacterium]|nr:HAD family phosphatase [Methylococcales bacterium]MDD5633385.1 HAD family phosphatase [Methylococcales bacterium]
MFKLSDFSAVIFDMDGLVLDTETTYFIAWRQAAKTMGFVFSEAFCSSLSGLHYQDIEPILMAYCGADFNLPAFNRLSGMFWRKHVNAYGIDIKHGFTQLLEFIVQQQLPYCLATNSRAVNAYECLELAGIKDVFSIVVTRDDVERGKPAPDVFLRSAELLQVPINQCLVLEDSHAGIEAASRAGAFSIFVPSTEPVDSLTVELCDLMRIDLAHTLITLKEGSF